MILSLDAASNLTGYSLFNEKVELVEYGFFDFTKVKDIDARIHKVKKAILNLIETYKVDLVLLEDIQYQRNVKTYRVLARLQGVLLDMFFDMGLSYNLISCKTWKSKCGIKQKTDSITFVKNKFGIDVNNDVADAICLGWSNLLKGDK